jgi:hypothetical protein
MRGLQILEHSSLLRKMKFCWRINLTVVCVIIRTGLWSATRQGSEFVPLARATKMD